MSKTIHFDGGWHTRAARCIAQWRTNPRAFLMTLAGPKCLQRTSSHFLVSHCHCSKEHSTGSLVHFHVAHNDVHGALHARGGGARSLLMPLARALCITFVFSFPFKCESICKGVLPPATTELKPAAHAMHTAALWATSTITHNVRSLPPSHGSSRGCEGASPVSPACGQTGCGWGYSINSTPFPPPRRPGFWLAYCSCGMHHHPAPVELLS